MQRLPPPHTNDMPFRNGGMILIRKRMGRASAALTIATD
jgi:hypothetical protein